MTKRIVILTGAGISAESGIQTFRASDGLWHEHRVEDVASPDGFASDPMLVHQFYNARRSQLLSPEIKPNSAHYALASLQKNDDLDVMIVTQNIDDLHERAGSKTVFHMHGELLKSRCISCGNVAELTEDLSIDSICQACGESESLRPHIVWFGEVPFYMSVIDQAIKQADLFIAIGTSGHVYPAAGFVNLANSYNVTSLQMNLEPAQNSKAFDHSIIGLASETVSELVENLGAYLI